MFNNRWYLIIIAILLLGNFSGTGNYNVGSGTTGSIPSINPTVDDSWNFTIFGDTRQQSGTWDSTTKHYTHDNASNPIRAAIVKKMVDENPAAEFIIHTGDAVMSGAEQDDWNRYLEDISPITDNNLSVYYAVGNHEYYTYALGDGIYGPSDPTLTAYLASVDLPGNERYYSFDYNNQVHFVFINTEENWDGEYKITTEQSDWLVNDLSSNTIDLVVAVYHRPSYSIRSSSRVEDAREIRSVLGPILEQYGVDLVFSGHDHYYYRTTRNDITYITAGGGGANLYTNGDTSDWIDGDVYFSKYEYSTAIVTNGAITVNTYSFDETDNTISLSDTVVIGDEVSDMESSETSSTTQISGDTSSSNTLLFIFPIGLILLIPILRKRSIKSSSNVRYQ